MQFKTQLLAILLLWYYSPLKAWGEYDILTPLHHRMVDNRDNKGQQLILKNGKKFSNIRTWYFYKEHIIGYTRKFIGERKPDSTIYFVVEERSGKSVEFYREDTWQEHLKQNDLVPQYYTRWHHDSWQRSILLVYVFYAIMMLLAFGLYSIIGFLLIGFLVYRLSKARILSFKKILIRFLLFFAFLAILDALTSLCPQSI